MHFLLIEDPPVTKENLIEFLIECSKKLDRSQPNRHTEHMLIVPDWMAELVNNSVLEDVADEASNAQ